MPLFVVGAMTGGEGGRVVEALESVGEVEG